MNESRIQATKDSENKVWACLKERPMTVTELSEATGWQYDSVRKMLYALRDTGFARKSGRQWVAAR
jgi:transcription initiation factor IIE alpha subunit